MRQPLLSSLTSPQHSPILRAVRSAAVLGSLTGLFFCLTGCGLGTPALSTPAASTVSTNSFGGRILGGVNPIIGATVKAYTTGNSDGTNGGYGVATMQEEANAVTNPSGYPSGDTDTNGAFFFPAGLACPSGQFLYIVSAGGNTGASTTASGAAATATYGGGGDGTGVASIAVTDAGSGYLSATVTITPAEVGGPGSGATAAAQISGGMITGVTVTASGSGYDTAPTVTISAPTDTNGANNNAVMVAPLGSCDTLFTGGNYTGGRIIMNELTTISAAYALGHFSSESGSGSSTVVSIGAPATNNAAEVSGVSTGCVAGDPVEGNSSTICAATASAGLAHAFLNAASLVSVSPTTVPTGGANLNPPSNSTAIAPQALVNTLGNILVSCVNSSGGVANDGSACGSLFKATTIGTSVPIDTFGAMVNLAANPTLGGSSTAVANFLALASTFTNVYTPFLSSASDLNDYSLAIDYPAGTGAVTGAQGVTYPNSGALDMNDVYFIGNQVGSSGAGENIISLASNGAVLGASPNSTTKLAVEYGLSVDALGNGYFGNSTKSSTDALGYFTAVNGVPNAFTDITVNSSDSAKIVSTAVDRHNNVWVLSDSTSKPSVFESAAGAASFTAVASSSISVISQDVADIAIDPNQNVWTVAGADYSVVPNSGTVSNPAYAATLLAGATGSTVTVGITFAGTGPFTTANPFVAYVSSYNTSPTGVQPFAPTLNANGEVTAANPGTLQTSTESSGSYFDEADGDGTVWTAATNDHAIIYFVPGAAGSTAPTAAYRYEPCVVISPATKCTSMFAGGKPYDISIDSTGSIWIPAPDSTTSGSVVVQIIGAAAPTVPLLSLGLTGKP